MHISILVARLKCSAVIQATPLATAFATYVVPAYACLNNWETLKRVILVYLKDLGQVNRALQHSLCSITFNRCLRNTQISLTNETGCIWPILGNIVTW